jgi:hypothetical protein
MMIREFFRAAVALCCLVYITTRFMSLGKHYVAETSLLLYAILATRYSCRKTAYYVTSLPTFCALRIPYVLYQVGKLAGRAT